MRCAAQVWRTPSGTVGYCRREVESGRLINGYSVGLCAICYRVSALKPIVVVGPNSIVGTLFPEPVEVAA